MEAIILDEYSKATLTDYRKVRDHLLKMGAVPKALWTTTYRASGIVHHKIKVEVVE